ncbi:MAG: thioesterase family protein [Flavobacteriaceae bacterium]|nr:thioesterase family protein [Flavobacteriaceae bacterium]
MEINIPEGAKLELKRTVTLNDTASKYGSGLAEVFATPAMIAFMEQTSYKCIEEFLPEGFGSVGVSVNIQHKKATLPNKQVRCEATVKKVEGKKVYFDLVAFDEDGEIGAGEHIRYIINNADFMTRLK